MNVSEGCTHMIVARVCSINGVRSETLCERETFGWVMVGVRPLANTFRETDA